MCFDNSLYPFTLIGSEIYPKLKLESATYFFLGVSDTNMNYSSAVKGRLTRSSVISYVSSQSELELGRPLSKEEEVNLFERFAAQDIFNRIHKVGLKHS